MILTKDQIRDILETIRKRHNLFVVKTIGQELLSEAELEELRREYGEDAIVQLEDFVRDGYFAGYLRNKDLGSVTEISHEEFKGEEKPRLTDLEQYSVEQSKEVVNSYLSKLSQEVRTNLEQLIRDYNKRYKDFLMTNTGVPMSIIADFENRSVGDLLIAMRDLTGDKARDWDRVARTETTNVLNTGMADKIIKMNPDKEADEIIVYKRVIDDGRLCVHCRRLHLSNDGVTPKLYKLSEVLANGNNVGKRASDWQMIINSVHPHCRCTLVQLPPGYFFNKEGKMEYIGEKDASEKIKKVV